MTTTSSAGLMISREFDKLFNDLGSASSRHRNLLNIAYRQTKINKEIYKITTTPLTDPINVDPKLAKSRSPTLISCVAGMLATLYCKNV